MRRRIKTLVAFLLAIGFFSQAVLSVFAYPTDRIADKVYGTNGSFISNGLSTNTLFFPKDIAVDSSGGIYVADSENNRVLYYPSGQTTPSRVYGQGNDFTTNNINKNGLSADSLYLPTGVAVNNNGVYIADKFNDRVLYFQGFSDTTADIVYGQPNFNSDIPNNGGISANSLYNPWGVTVDSNGVYIADTVNNRVLFFSGFSDTTADKVFGQSGSFSTNSANNGGISAGSLYLPTKVAVDNTGIYITDTNNHRVLFYNNTLVDNDTFADKVYGQEGVFNTGDLNKNGVTADSLYDPLNVTISPTGIYITDNSNHRVLFYDNAPADTTADRVYGQGGSFTTNIENNGGISANSLASPFDVALDATGILIADELNNRFLHFSGNATTADAVYGQNGSFITNNKIGGVTAQNLYLPSDIAIDSNGGVYLCDTGSHRVLFFPAGSTSPTRVYGQGSVYTSATPNKGGISADSLNAPRGVAVDSTGVYIADTGNNRVLFYAGFSDTTADRVYGQPAFNSNSSNNGGVSNSSLFSPYDVFIYANTVYVADRNNHRVLSFNGVATSANKVYGQLNNFTTNTQNNGGISANSLAFPSGVAVDSSGVFIADSINNRVLFYSNDTSDTTADRVYGQTAFNTNSYGVSATKFDKPSSLIADPVGLFVSDTGNNRVLRFSGTSTTADQVLGQPDFSNNSSSEDEGISAVSLFNPFGIASDGFGLYVADKENNRVLYYEGIAASTTSVSANPNPSIFGQNLVITATVNSNALLAQGVTGTVTILDNGVSIGSSSLITVDNFTSIISLTTNTIPAGIHNFTAQYGGNALFASSVSTSYLQTVNKANTTTNLVSSKAVSLVGESVIFTATVSPSAPATQIPTNTVEFYKGATLLGMVALDGNGKAEFTVNTLLTGNYNITAKYAGSSNYNISISNAVGLTVSKTNTATVINTSASSVGLGDNLFITATINTQPPSSGVAPNGTVSFFDGATKIGEANLVPLNSSTSTASLSVNNLSVGVHSLSAQYSGNADFFGSNSANLNVEVKLLGTVKLLANTQRVASTLTQDGLNSPKLTASGSVPAPNISQSTVELNIGGNNNIPANATGIFGVLTNVGCSGGGNFRFFTGNTVPNAANLNVPGALFTLNLSTNFIAPLSNGKVKLGLGSGANVTCGYVVDVSGYIVPPSANADRITLLENTVRIASTQPGDGLNSPKLTAIGQIPSSLVGSSTVEFTIGGNNNIPANAKGIIGVLTNVGCTGGGNFRFFTGNTVPNAANLNVPGALATLNLSTGFIAALDTEGKLKLGLGSGASVTCGYVMDVVGYINTPETGSNLTLLPTTIRVASTQSADNLNSPKLTATNATPINTGTGVSELVLGGKFNIPADAKGVFGVLVNVGCSGGGNFRFWTGNNVPNASNLNIPGALFTLNLSTGFTTGLEVSGKVKLGLGSGKAITCGYVTDVVGYLN
jgi:hypothetical protein